MNKEEIVSITSEDIELYNRARAINLPAIVISMYGDRIKKLLAEEREAEREACAKVCEDSVEYAGDTLAESIRARRQA